MAVDAGTYSIVATCSNDVGPSSSEPFDWVISDAVVAEPVWAAAVSEYFISGAGSHEFLPEHIGAGNAPTFNHQNAGSDLLLPDNLGVYVTISANTVTAYGAREGGGAAGRKILVEDKGWDISDGGPA